MAGVGVNPGGDSKRNFSVELNLVPFIDLLSTLVLFLLVTTVWMQISMIPVGTPKPGDSAAASTAKPVARVELKLTREALQLKWPAALAEFPTSIAPGEAPKILAEAHSKDPDLAASVTADESVEYGQVIHTIDVARSAGISSVGLAIE
jgi:biopolymer transport protein TolR